MRHRHLNHEDFTLAAIDDVMDRGTLSDWQELRLAVLADRTMMERVLSVAKAHIHDPYAQRYHFWKNYAEHYLA